MGTSQHQQAVEALAEYPANSGCILYRDGSRLVKTWVIGADPAVDNEESIREHLHRSLPAAEFIDWAIK